MKNWKSLLTWVIFAISYNYAIYTGKSEPVVYTTGLFTLVMGLIFIFRTEMTKDSIAKIVDAIATKFKNN